MAIPPRDAAGRVEPHDDPDISDDAYVVRYVHVSQLRPDEAGHRRLSSGAFSPSSKHHDPYCSMSADLLDSMLKDGVAPSAWKRPERHAVVKLRVRDLRRLGLQVGSDPQTDNPYHVGVWGMKRQHRKQLHRLCEWVEKPDDVLK